MNSYVKRALQLKVIDPRASYFIAKELALINVNMLWYPEKEVDYANRLISLAEHITTTFKKNAIAASLADDVSELGRDILAYLDNQDEI